ncbi:MAG: chemotaxis protein CheC [Ardenticatenales bacterium]|nr:chemotaxis protein CheC [Ardenticatenales bacterium]
MDRQVAFWKRVMMGREFKNLVQEALGQAAGGLSRMVGQAVVIDVPRIERVPLRELEQYTGALDSQMVGIYLLIEGDVGGQALLLCTPLAAMRLADLLLLRHPGTTQALGVEERSALAEMGNLTISLFLNEVAEMMGLMLYPSPPAVMVDMLGALLDVVIFPLAGMSHELLLVDTRLHSETSAVEVHLWLLPMPAARRSDVQDARYG